MINATVGILTLNSSKNIYKCLNSLNHFKQIIILDGGSIDSTLEIAKKSNKKIIVYEKKITLTRILMLYSQLVYKLNVFKKVN